MVALEFTTKLPTGEHLLDIVEWGEDGRVINGSYSEAAIYRYLFNTGQIQTNDEWLETSKTIDIFLDLLKCIAMPRNEKGEVVSKVTVELE